MRLCNLHQYTHFAISNTFMSNPRMKLEKNKNKNKKKMLSNTLRLNFCYLKIIRILHLGCHPKTTGYFLKNRQKNKFVCVHEIRLIIMKMKMKMQNRSHRFDIKRPRSRHWHKYSKHKKCLSMLLFICIKQHLSNI